MKYTPNLYIFILIETFSAYVIFVLLHVISFCCSLSADSLFKELFILRFFMLSQLCLKSSGYTSFWSYFSNSGKNEGSKRALENISIYKCRKFKTECVKFLTGFVWLSDNLLYTQ